MPDRRTLAAVDLGSNSFHMLVARLEHGEVRVIDRIREMVRLAEGLNHKGELEDAVRQRALACLARFGERLRDVPRQNIRAVGTQTFRRLNHPGAFLRSAEKALNCPIEIIGGREEARLIYAGVISGVPQDQQQRLVIDIGGGSTELIIGRGPTPTLMESLQYGCVTLTQNYFSEKHVNRKRWQRARNALLGDLQEISLTYQKEGWEHALGTSGTIRAIRSVCVNAGWSESGISRGALSRLSEYLQTLDKTSDLNLAGLSERRQPVFVGGVLILDALFEALKLDHLAVSDYALREGLLHDIIGRRDHRDPRDATITAMAMRYGVDQEQAQRVQNSALCIFDQIAAEWKLDDSHRDLLRWTAQVHEIGLGISHSRYQRHSGYLLSHSDMAGFSRLEQLMMSFLARYHRRMINSDWHERIPRRLHHTAAQLLLILRLAVILHRSRSPRSMPDIRVGAAKKHKLRLQLPYQWMEERPLTLRDLKQEKAAIKALELNLGIVEMEPVKAAIDQSA